MIIRFVKMTFAQEHVEDFKNFEKSIYDTIVGFDGCEYLNILQDVNNPQVFFTHSHWRDEQALNNYRHSEFFKKTWAKTKQWFCDKPEAWSLKSVK